MNNVANIKNVTITVDVFKCEVDIATGRIGANNSLVGASGDADDLIAGDGSGSHGVTILSGVASSGSLRFADSGGTGRGILLYDHATDSFQLHVAGSQKLGIDSAGKVDIPGVLENPQTSKAWVNFNGAGTVAIRDSHNVSSITDNGAGDYTVNFTSAFPDVNYSPVLSAGEGVDDVVAVIHTISTGSVRTQLNNFGGTLIDAIYVTLNAFGN